MTSNVSAQSNRSSLIVRMAIGAAIGALIISYIVFGVLHPPVEWGEYWRVRPLIIVPFAGAMAGLCNFLLIHYHTRFGIRKTVAMILSVVIAVIGLWLGIVLGLDGTLWN